MAIYHNFIKHSMTCLYLTQQEKSCQYFESDENLKLKRIEITRSIIVGASPCGSGHKDAIVAQVELSVYFQKISIKVMEVML
jgi:hypothetical protein